MTTCVQKQIFHLKVQWFLHYLIGFYYAGYGILLLPSLGIIESYGGRTPEYYNAFGLYLSGITSLKISCYNSKRMLTQYSMVGAEFYLPCGIFINVSYLSFINCF